MGDFRQAVVEKLNARSRGRSSDEGGDNAFCSLQKDATKNFNGQRMRKLSYLENVKIDWDA